MLVYFDKYLHYSHVSVYDLHLHMIYASQIQLLNLHAQH
jgi:hypothetical protein